MALVSDRRRDGLRAYGRADSAWLIRAAERDGRKARSMPRLQRRGARVDRAHHLDGVRLRRVLVGTVALHAGEAERESGRVVRALLHVIEGDLDDLLRP